MLQFEEDTGVRVVVQSRAQIADSGWRCESMSGIWQDSNSPKPKTLNL